MTLYCFSVATYSIAWQLKLISVSVFETLGLSVTICLDLPFLQNRELYLFIANKAAR